MDLNKKALAVIAAAVLAALSGGAEVLSLGERVEALESIHPELTTDIPLDPHTPGDGSQLPSDPEVTEEPGAEPESAEPAESADPAPGADHLELDESDEWVEAEEPA